jgi:hypothetical protein
MPRYSKIPRSIWNESTFRGLSGYAKLTYFLFLSFPHQTSVGAMRATVPGLAAELGCSVRRLRSAVNQLIEAGYIEVDDDASYIGIRDFLRWNRPENPNVMKSWVSVLELLPDCRHKDHLCEGLREMAEELGEPFLKAFREAFRKGLPIQKQEQKQEQEQKDKEADSLRSEFREDFEVWRSTLPNSQAGRVKPTEDRWAKYRARRGDSERSEIREALQGWKHDPWPERSKNNDFKILLRDRSQVEKFSRYFRDPPPPPRRTEVASVGGDESRRSRYEEIDRVAATGGM